MINYGEDIFDLGFFKFCIWTEHTLISNFIQSPQKIPFDEWGFITQEICMQRKIQMDPNILLLIFSSFLFFILFSWSIIASIDILLGQLLQKEQEIRKLKNPQQGKSFITVKGRESFTIEGKYLSSSRGVV